MVTVVLIKHTRKKLGKGNKKKEVTQGTIKALLSIVSVMVMFGLSWLFGALSISDGAIVFQWPFVIFNTLQGFILFLFSCVIGKDARDEWTNLLTCYRRKKNQRHSTVSHSQTSSSRLRKSGSQSNSTKMTDLPTSSYKLRKPDWSSSTICSKSEVPLSDHGFSNKNLSKISEESNFVVANDSAIRDIVSVSEKLVEEIKVDMTSESIPVTPTLETIKRTRKKSESVLPPHVLFRLNRPYYEVIVEDAAQMELSQETDFSQDVPELSDYDVFSNLTGDSTVALINDHA